MMYLYFKTDSLRTITNKFILSLAFCDILVAVIFIPFYLVFDELVNESIGLSVNGYFSSFSGFGSLFNLAALTYERYVAIFDGLRYFVIMNGKKVRSIMTAIWTSTLLLTLLPLPWKLKTNHDTYTNFIRIYTGILTGTIILVNVIIFIAYIRIFLVNRHHFMKTREQIMCIKLTRVEDGNTAESPSVTQVTKKNSVGFTPRIKSRAPGRESLIAELKAARAVAIIVLVNCICWLPIIVINICDVSSESGLASYLPNSFIICSQYFFVLNSMLNPFIYALCKQDFRKSIRKCIKQQS